MMNLPNLSKYFPYLPTLPPELEKMRAFEALWAATLQGGEGRLIEYSCAYPKHEFLSYLVERKGYLLHGSNHAKIKVLMPFRMSIDATSYGNHEAAYACSDGLWPIYYAIAHRRCPKVSLRSSCFRAPDTDGTEKKYYFFSIHEEMHKSQPWTDGMVYVLPRRTFRQLRNELGLPVEEWASDEPVPATAKLAVNAQDFPFLDSVQAHRDEHTAPTTNPFAAVAAKNYDKYAGHYALTSDLIVEVVKLGEQLFVKFPGYPPAVMSAVSENSFLLPPLDIHAAFATDERGNPSRLTIRLDGQDWVAQRLF